MSRPLLRDLETFLRGRAAEERVATWLQEHGWHVIPSYDYAGEDGDKPPRLQGYRVGYPVPDLDTAKDGERRWVEVKSKSDLIFWRKTQKGQHGIDLPLLQHYQTVQAITGTPVWLVIYEEWTGYLIGNTIDALGEPRIGTDRGKKIANWDRDKFRLIHKF
jgi:hypothetical protein